MQCLCHGVLMTHVLLRYIPVLQFVPRDTATALARCAPLDSTVRVARWQLARAVARARPPLPKDPLHPLAAVRVGCELEEG